MMRSGIALMMEQEGLPRTPAGRFEVAIRLLTVFPASFWNGEWKRWTAKRRADVFTMLTYVQNAEIYTRPQDVHKE